MAFDFNKVKVNKQQQIQQNINDFAANNDLVQGDDLSKAEIKAVQQLCNYFKKFNDKITYNYLGVGPKQRVLKIYTHNQVLKVFLKKIDKFYESLEKCGITEKDVSIELIADELNIWYCGQTNFAVAPHDYHFDHRKSAKFLANRKINTLILSGFVITDHDDRFEEPGKLPGMTSLASFYNVLHNCKECLMPSGTCAVIGLQHIMNKRYKNAM